MKHFDYIICGGGMAGLSLAYYLKKSRLKNKSVLIIEPQDKNTNDRTWAFWEKRPNTFEDILYRKWGLVQLIDANGNAQVIDMGGYQYKLLRGIDFYTFVTTELRKYAGLEWIIDSVKTIKEESDGAIVETQNGKILKASLVFDSTFQLDLTLKHNHNLLQHFKGYVVKTKTPFFDPVLPVMMNFNIEQKGDCRFIYILPFDKNTALIEYTLFSESLLAQDEYDSELRKYLVHQLQLPDYQILEKEFGVIPMSDVATEEFPSEHIIRIGTAGGYTNPATGYTFQNTQRKLQKMVETLERTGSPKAKKNWFESRFRFYASVLLNVLEQKRHPAADIFSKLYRKNPPVRVFRFLDGDTTMWEELQLMNTVPKTKFLAAVGAVIMRKIKARLSGQPHP
ncbi:lycopene cyclase family protein [Emticicia sp. BO119]|uniref:lycopene cyclase family protein n=1 Tax=Emticicia sp. BO119 TaxID=2757768 RepID=UPI0015EFE53E|nr:lycopene cyclase family protein [Emticicia sp. BO119]MBA4849181.1 NAD(P)-binding protein [Emticicia sp. BO119]